MKSISGWIKKGVFLAFVIAILFGIPAFADGGSCGCNDGGTPGCAGITGGSIDTPG